MTLTVGRSELLSGGNDELFRQAIHDALGFSVRLLEIRNRLGEVIGLGGPAYSILISIDHLSETGEVGVNRVADHLHLSGAFVTVEANKLVQAGLITKKPDPDDGRRVRLSVTDKAHRLLEELSETQRPVNDAIFAAFDGEDFERFARDISRLVTGTEEALSLLRFLAERRRRA